MARCEDFPCCGHEQGDCPDAQGRMRCVECQRRLPKNSGSSICPKCLTRISSDDYEDRLDHDFSMND